MIALSLHFLDGSSQSVTPEKTLAELRAEIEQELPAFHEFKLFHGNEELVDGAKVQVELQGIITKSPAKAIHALEQIKARANFEGRQVLTRATIDELRPAVAMLSEMEELEATLSKRLGDLILPHHFESFAFFDIGQWMKVEKLFDVHSGTLGRVFGRTCSEPASCLHEIIMFFQLPERGRDAVQVAAAALEMAKRCSELIPFKEREVILGWASRIEGNPWDSLWLPRHEIGFEILSLLANSAEHADRFQNKIEWLQSLIGVQDQSQEFVGGVQALCTKAEAALHVVYARARHSEANHSQNHGTDKTALSSGAGNVNQADESIPPVEDTDVGLDKALQESEMEVILKEQEDLHEAMLRSKIDSQQSSLPKPAPTCADLDHRLVLLCFQRCPKELHQCLIESRLALQLVAEGVQLQPNWADGRLVLAKGVTEAALSEAREPWHVAVEASHEEEILVTLRERLGRQRPRLSESGRFLVPQDLSLFDGSSASEHEEHTEDYECEWILEPVKRTFLHYGIAEAPARSSASAPGPF